MSSALAIAGITQVLKDLLNDGVINNITTNTGTTVTVTALPPDKIEDAGEQSQLNLYMYQATVNQGWRNEG
ncbi:MAG TPA: Pvc16 family protein, partial [Niabella sp.]